MRYLSGMHILISVLLGALAGWIAGRIMRGSGFGLLVNILLGIVGGFVGDLCFDLLGIEATNWIGRLLMAVVGAVLVILLVRAIRR